MLEVKMMSSTFVVNVPIQDTNPALSAKALILVPIGNKEHRLLLFITDLLSPY
jgi:hypothetical protein